MHPLGNILFIGVTRSEQISRTRFAMLLSQQYIPRIMFVQIIAAIIENILFHYISANIAHNCTHMMSRPMCSGSKIIKRTFLY